ncbi:MAG: 50S ribosomal protein L29 [Candidatus Uhrbacteria bacterium]
MDPKEMQKASFEALNKALQEAKDEKRSLCSALSAHQLSQVRKIREVRKTIARAKTFLGKIKVK